MAQNTWPPMQKWPLTVPYILDYAARWHPQQEIVCRTPEGPTVISSYADLHRRAQLATAALQDVGVRQGDVIATMAWNTTRHLEAWYGIMGAGAVCHTLNPRLSAADLIYIINDAKDQMILADITFVKLLESVVPNTPSVKLVVFLTDREHFPVRANLPKTLCWEDWLAGFISHLPVKWVPVEEDAPCGLCYTSGTTGRPKGVQYTHRSNFLHSFVSLLPDAVPFGANDTLLAVVPMFHANSWGLAFSAPLVGARLVMPGPHLDGRSVYEMLQHHKVTVTAGVPTVWLGLLQYMRDHSLTLHHLKMLVIGGAAASRAMIKEFENKHKVQTRHLWGMTEISPIGSISTPQDGIIEQGQEAVLAAKLKQGRPHIFCDMRIVDDDGRVLPHDGQAMGRLQVRGPIIVQQYHNIKQPATCDPEKWFDTGDVATIDEYGFMKITDRSKDVIKSGGEWISSIDIENLAQGHPGVQEAAVIAIPHPKWGERPLLVVHPTVQPGSASLKSELLQFMCSKLASWQVPDDVQFVAEIPHTATGKISKLTLRQMFKDYKLPTASRL